MNLQQQRIQHACDLLKLPAIAAEWSAMADHSATQDKSFADFLESSCRLNWIARCSAHVRCC